MMRIITRAEWGARPPLRPLTTVSWSRRVGVAVHYSQGNRDDTPLELQRYAQDTLGYADGHYNILVDYLGSAYEGRGWTVSAAHSEGENYEWVGIAFIGKDADVTAEAEATIAALVADANSFAGRELSLAGHQELPGAQTSCPGPRLMALVNRIRNGGNGMSVLTTEEQQALDNANKAMWWGGYESNLGKPVAREYWLNVDEHGNSTPGANHNSVAEQLAELRGEVAKILAALTDGVTVPAKVDLSEAAIDAVAEAVADEDHARSAD